MSQGYPGCESVQKPSSDVSAYGDSLSTTLYIFLMYFFLEMQIAWLMA